MSDGVSKNKFRKTILGFYSKNRRDFPWRETTNPYDILVSELMLQQTQVSRVGNKYPNFMKRFPTLQTLAEAPQAEVLKEWQGLGYNRRALNLKRSCEAIVTAYKGRFPKTMSELISLPGIGQSTAGAILNFAYNMPTPFIETNIRAVYLHFFFKTAESVTDKEILLLVQETLDTRNPRDWFYALYDYGAALKSSLGKDKTVLHKKSKHYTKQSPFKGSNRELRSRLLKFFITHKDRRISLPVLEGYIPLEKRTIGALSSLVKEGFIEHSLKSNSWRLKA